MTPVPIHTPIRVPGTSASPSHAPGPATPHAPGSPQATPGNPDHQQHPQQDSLQDIRADLDHYPGGLTQPDPADQQALDNAVPRNEDGTPQRHPDPFEGNWSQLQNDGGVNVPGRSNNCADCSRSFLETWYGNPQVSAPRTLDLDEHGKPNLWSPEHNANDNQIRWAGAAHTYAGPGGDPNTANNIADTLQQAGPGSAAIVQVDWPGGGGHAFNVVNHNGNIVWVDTQSGDVSHAPLHIDQATHVWHIPLDADGHPIDTSQPHAQDSENGDDASQNENNDASQPENSENNGQPQNDQNPQNDAPGDTPKQGDDTDGGTDSPKPADQATPDASDTADPVKPSTADANTSPDPMTTSPDSTNGKPQGDDGRPQSESNSQSESDNSPNGREPSSDDSNAPQQKQPEQSPETPTEQNHTSSAETPNTLDQQSRPDQAPHPDEEGRTPDTDSTQPTATTESPSRTESPSEHQQPPTRTTPDNADKGTTPTRTATDTPSALTTDRDAPQQPAPHITDPRPSDPRTSASRTSDPQRDAPPQKKPDAGEPRDGQRPNTPPRPERQAVPAPDRTNRPAPADPSGANPSRFNAEEVRGSAEFGERQTVEHTHFDMPPEDSQQTLRRTHDVSQIDLGPVLDNAHRWAKDGSLARAVEEARKNGSISQSRLNEILGKKFEELSREQKMAVVAGIARISNTFHEAHAAGNSPVQGDPERRRPKGVTNDINPLAGVSMHENHEVRRMKDGDDKAPPDARARDYAVTHEAESADPADKQKKDNEFEALWRQHKDGDMRPDMSGKNYAVLEVHEKVGDKVVVKYVIDSSIPGSDRYHHDHSEPHLGEWMRNVEAKHPGQFKAVALFTEFEPCGDRTGTGGANCSDYLSHDMERDPDASRARTKKARDDRPEEVKENPPKSNMPVSYGIGYRKGAMGNEAAAQEGEYESAAEKREAVKQGKALDNAKREQVKALTDEQMVKYRGEWLRVWMNAVGSPGGSG
ncbi:toxin glutamine deamidase domain-containing protein [Streptomyces sp. NPDC001107]